MPTTSTYLNRHGLLPPQISAPPSPRLDMAVIIPCHDEPYLDATLDCLWACERPACAVEVIVVINGSEADAPDVRRRNRDTYRTARAWIREHQDPGLRFHPLYLPALPSRHAGVGLARKLGMDEAVSRLQTVGQADGILVGLDADCRCQPNYLASIHRHFARHPRTPGCTIYFEHPVHQVPDPRLQLGITRYELHMRYYLRGLRHAHFPHAFHTVGSCMAVRRRIYERQGGMNRRQAGEDFYFLHKVIPLGGFSELRDTVVEPAVRISRRTPFGTGKALGDWVHDQPSEYLGCSPQVFADLRSLFLRVGQLRLDASPACILDGLSPTLSAFLEEQAIFSRLAEIRANTGSPGTFRRRFFNWFNAFRAFKYVRYATHHAYGQVPVEQAALALLHRLGSTLQDPDTAADADLLLQRYRELDRQGTWG